MTDETPSTDESNGTPRARLSRRKRVLFALLSVALALGALAVLEGGLRLAGFGGYDPFFREVGAAPSGARLIATDSRGLKRFFFRNPRSAGTFRPAIFEDPKPEGTIRILLIGGSAIKGYPHTRALASSAFLEDLLTSPDGHVEVINLGCTAAASFPALEILRDALRFQPDLVVIYAGHNEFFGAYGVASLNSVARSSTMISLIYRLRSLAIVQAIDSIVARAGRRNTAPTGQMLMDTMIGQDFIAPADPIRDAAARNLQAHIESMLQACRANDVPATVCTLPVNERGLAPLGEPDVSALGETDRRRLGAILARADKLIDSGLGVMIDDLAWAVDAAPEHARAWWLLGRAHDEADRMDEALHALQRAVDLDPMPWRATSIQNDAIRAAAAAYNAPIVDVEARFRSQSRPSAVGWLSGWGLMDDHVHMSLRGQALVAHAIADEILRSPADPPRGFDGQLSRTHSGIGTSFARLGVSGFERYAAAHRMSKLFDLPFFASTNAHAQRLMHARIGVLEARMVPDERRAAHAWKDPSVNPNYAYPISAFVGRVHRDAGRHAAAAPHLRVAMRTFSPYTPRRLEFAALWLDSTLRSRGALTPDQLDIARDHAAQGEALLRFTQGAGGPATRRYTGKLLLILGEHDRAAEHLLTARTAFTPTERVALDMDLIDCLVATNRRADAIELARRAIDEGGAPVGVYRERLDQLQRDLRGAGNGQP